jgi:protein-tyrosine phosphatase
MSAGSPTRVLFVCMGNICRSPAAEIIFRKLVDDAGLTDQFEIDSAGTINYHAGSPPDRRMAETLRKRGYSITGEARQIRSADLSRFDFILTMDETNLDEVRHLDPTGAHHSKIVPMVRFARSHDDPRVPDPYYGGQRGFDHVTNLLEDACDGFLDFLKRKN